MATNKNFVVKNGLEVGGNVIVTGNITQAGLVFPNSDGTSGQYLQTDGSGNLTWNTVVSSFNVSNGTTTDQVNTGETLTFTGGTNITVSVTDNGITFDNDIADSDDITEGLSNLFFTETRAVDAIEGHAHLTIDGGTLYVDTANNYVGIGDTSPQHKLDVAGGIGINGTEVIDSGAEVITARLKDSGVTAGSYGSASLVPVITVDAKGRITSASTTSVAGVSSFSFNGTSEVLTINTADGGTYTADISALASESYVATAISNLVDSAPGTLDTLNELAAALGDDPNFATTVATAINGKVDKTGDTMTGNLDVQGTVTADGLTVDASMPVIFFEPSADTETGYITFNNTSGSARGFMKYNYSNDSMSWRTAGISDRMTIDSSGNLLVGRSTFNNGAAGIDLAADGFLQPIRSGNIAARFVRLSTDGDIVHFRKDGTTVGSIGTTANHLTIGHDDVGVRFHSVNNLIYPHNMTTGATPDGTISFGTSSSRFKDLYLSGIVNASEINLDFAGDVHSSVTTGYVGVAGGTASNSGANAIFYGPANGSNPNKTLFRVGNTVSVTIDADGDVGIGTTPFTHARLTLGGTSASYNSSLVFDNNYTDASGAEFFMLATDSTWTAGSNKFIMGHGTPGSGNVDVTIDSSGRVGIGTYNPNRKLEVVSDIDGSPLRIQGNSSVTQMEFAVSGGAVEAGIASSANELAFRVGSSSSSAEKLRITTAGYYYFNSTGGHGPGGMVNITNGGTNTVSANALNVRSDTSNYALTLTNTVNGDCIWFSDNGTNGRGSITVTSSGTTYNTTSDRRLKDNITTITNGKEKLLAMNPVTHTWKADPNTGETVHGFIAQEMQEVIPEAVSGDAESDDMMSMDYGRITPVIVAALQDALKEIEELKTRINELEAK